MTAMEIIDAVMFIASNDDTRFTDIKAVGREPLKVAARQIAVGLLRYHTKLGYQAIATIMSRSDSAVYLAEQSYRKRLKKGDKAFIDMRKKVLIKLGLI